MGGQRSGEIGQPSLRERQRAEREVLILHEAERLLREELERRHWSVADLSQCRKGDSEKVAIARRLRTETTMSWKWIAQNLIMGSAQYAANCVQQNNHE